MVKIALQKGTYQYIKKQRKREIVKTVCMLGISIALYVIGYVTAHTNKNWLTLVAVLGCLPASKSAVSMIMFMKAKGCSETVKNQVEQHVHNLKFRFDLYLTSYSKNFQVSHAVMKNKNLVGFTEDTNFDEAACMEHLKTMFLKNGFKDITIKIFKDLDKYLERLDSLSASEADDQNDRVENVLSLLEDLSL